MKFDKRLKKTEIGDYVAKEWNDRLIQVLKTFVRICDKYHLRYYMAYGSAIGAIRHKGIIPWDDDIDVLMPWPDYNKFIEICKTENLDECELMDSHVDPSLFPSYVLLADKNSSLLLWRRHLAVLGLFIDIFPLCGICDDDETAIKLYDRMAQLQRDLSACSNKYTLGNLWNFICSGQTSRVVRYLRLTFNRQKTRQRILKEMDEIRGMYDYETSKRVANFIPYYNPVHIFPHKWFDDTIDVEFEGLKVKLMKGYHEFLTTRYGDYMQLPPIEERDDRHEFDYLNLQERRTREEILKEIAKQGR